MKNNKIKKIIALILFCFTTLVLFTGCFDIIDLLPKNTYIKKEIGNFVVEFQIENNICNIIGTTEKGNEMPFLVVPESIDGFQVENFTSPRYSQTLSLDIKSDKLKKIYIKGEVFMSRDSFSNANDCPNLKKIIFIKEKYHRTFKNVITYYSKKSCDKIGLHNHYITQMKEANVSYYYNYDNAVNNGYYWIDDFDYGDKIEYIPSEPVREGYKFGGWYKEKDCINKWDFDMDTLPEEITKEVERNTEDGVMVVDETVYQETILYAKWI